MAVAAAAVGWVGDDTTGDGARRESARAAERAASPGAASEGKPCCARMQRRISCCAGE